MQSANSMVQASAVPSDHEKKEKIKFLKVWLPETRYTDAKLYRALSKTNWDADKAFEFLMEEDFNQHQQNSDNQRKLTETNSMHALQQANVTE